MSSTCPPEPLPVLLSHPACATGGWRLWGSGDAFLSCLRLIWAPHVVCSAEMREDSDRTLAVLGEHMPPRRTLQTLHQVHSCWGQRWGGREGPLGSSGCGFSFWAPGRTSIPEAREGLRTVLRRPLCIGCLKGHGFLHSCAHWTNPPTTTSQILQRLLTSRSAMAKCVVSDLRKELGAL